MAQSLGVACRAFSLVKVPSQATFNLGGWVFPGPNG